MCTVFVVNTALVKTQTIKTREILTLEHWLAAYGARLVQLVGIDQSTQCVAEGLRFLCVGINKYIYNLPPRMNVYGALR